MKVYFDPEDVSKKNDRFRPGKIVRYDTEGDVQIIIVALADGRLVTGPECIIEVDMVSVTHTQRIEPYRRER
ncbi:MAG: hypothetical protein VXB01_14890 [Opitutae bacterium]